MVQLYGNSRNLLPVNMGAGSRGDRSLFVFFALQVSLIRIALIAPRGFCAALTCLALNCTRPHLTSPHPHLTLTLTLTPTPPHPTPPHLTSSRTYTDMMPPCLGPVLTVVSSMTDESHAISAAAGLFNSITHALCQAVWSSRGKPPRHAAVTNWSCH